MQEVIVINLFLILKALEVMINSATLKSLMIHRIIPWFCLMVEGFFIRYVPLPSGCELVPLEGP